MKALINMARNIQLSGRRTYAFRYRKDRTFHFGDWGVHFLYACVTTRCSEVIDPQL